MSNIRVYDVIPENECKTLISLFDLAEKHHDFINNNAKPCFTQLNVNRHYPEVVESLIPYARKAYGMYSADVKNKYLPKLRCLEEFRIKRYNPGGEERFDEHVDVTRYESAKRALAFLFYLNDNDGDTRFSYHDLSITPEAGKVVVFPPTWEYPHAGLAPSSVKYVMSTYVHLQ